ncbi:MAG: AAA family ATPase [Deltaproteobacteria bacterium]|nr:AAA family ATPase [Deltaproteobacteria bacterium]
MICQACNHSSPDSARFCAQCGEGLGHRCTDCGAPIVVTARYCSQCGAAQSPVASAPEQRGPAVSGGELRQMTAMFCDLVGSMRLAHQLDPEDYRDLVASYQDVCSAEIERFDGRVAQFLGDGVLVYFGFPRAHEDDAERAVRTALAIQDRLREENDARKTKGGAPIESRIGIHTGPVVVSELGAGDQSHPLAVGDTINIAARLDAVAEPGGIVISQATLRLVPGAFITRDLGMPELKGVSEPVRVHAVERGLAVGALPFAAQHLTRLAGRDLELAELLDRWGQVKEGRGQVISISGEAGIGKSRLVHALRRELTDDPHGWQEICCSPYHGRSAFQPAVELLESGLGIRDIEETTIRLEKFEAGLSGIPDLDPAEVMPFLAPLLGLPPSERYPLPALGPELMREKTLRALMLPLLAVEPRQPIVLIVEDLHWADPSTLELIAKMIDEAATIRLLLVLTSRPGFDPPWPARSYVFPLRLSPLGREQTRSIVKSAARNITLPARIVDEIVERADGVPLFAEELTRSVVESGMVVEGEAAPQFRGRISDLTIPTTLRDSLMARLDRLTTAKLVAQIAATLGREFPYLLLEAVAELDPAILRKGLGELVEAEILFQRGAPPDAHYSFKHSLLQDMAYESQLKTRRKKLHAAIARALEEHFPERVASEPEVLAHHCAGGGLVPDAITYFERAAEVAVMRQSNAEAIEGLSRALALLATLPDSHERQQQEMRLRMTLAGPQTAARGYDDPDVMANLARAEALCDGLDAGPEQLAGLVPIAVYNATRGDFPKASRYASRVLGIAGPAGIPELQVAGHMIFGSAAMSSSPISVAVAHLERAVELAGVTILPPPTAAYDLDNVSLAHGMYALASVLDGHPHRAARHVAMCLERAEGLNHVNSLGSARLNAAIIHYVLDDADRTALEARQLLEAIEDRGFHSYYSSGRVFEGWARVMKGDIDGLEELAEGVALAEESGSRAGIVQIYFAATNACIAAGDFDRAGEHLERARKMIELTKERTAFEPQVSMLRAKIAIRAGLGTDQEIEALLDDSTRRWKVFGSQWMEVRTAILRGELAKKTGNRHAALEQLSRLCARFEDAPARGQILEARKLLAELGPGGAQENPPMTTDPETETPPA